MVTSQLAAAKGSVEGFYNIEMMNLAYKGIWCLNEFLLLQLLYVS